MKYLTILLSFHKSLNMEVPLSKVGLSNLLSGIPTAFNSFLLVNHSLSFPHKPLALFILLHLHVFKHQKLLGCNRKRYSIHFASPNLSKLSIFLCLQYILIQLHKDPKANYHREQALSIVFICYLAS